ncbi:hypothetical protein [Leisingera sp. F5]|uniref:hypothetical protein n=1 Tax=Leisingera sp. F5 TaxID=1813816 RepID=UPI000B133FAE|nr:hypothetical protein [Leisingera sp. F5]
MPASSGVAETPAARRKAGQYTSKSIPETGFQLIQAGQGAGALKPAGFSRRLLAGKRSGVDKKK